MLEYINQSYPNKYGEIDPDVIPEQQRAGFWDRWAAKRVGAPSPEEVRASGGKRLAQQRVQGLLGQRPELYQGEMMGAPAQGQPAPQFARQPVMEGGEGRGLLGGKSTPAEFYGGLLTTPGYENMGSQGLQGLLATRAPKPTSVMQNLSAAGYNQGTPEYQAAMKDYLTKAQTQINMGSKHITAADAQKMRNSKNEMPPIGMTYEDAGQAGFGYINPAEETEIRTQSETLGSMKNSLDTYEDIVTGTGTMAPWQMLQDPIKYNALTSAYSSLQLEYKELVKLGVLTGPDMGLIEAVIQDPTSIKANLQEMVSGKKISKKQLDTVRGKLNAGVKRAEARYGKNWRSISPNTVNFEDLK